NKQQKQIENDGKSFVVKDDIEFGYLNVIPLWAFGLNY
ncbi:MAG: 3-dehydroquinate dehydratase, partial [Flavobacteriia bacterium]